MSGRDPWLVVIDMQRVFADEASPWATPDFPVILPTVQELVERFEGRVVFTRFVPRGQPEGSWVDYYERWPFALEPEAAAGWEIVSGLSVGRAPVVDVPTMGKWGDALFSATGQSRDLVLCGVSTECCVLSTALAAADAGAWVRVVSDACAGASAADHDRALRAMAMYAPQVEVVTGSSLAA
jgi:nicotinamidase-related amidase